jgi:hypothetical protein
MRYGQIEGVIVRFGQESHLAVADPFNMDMLSDVKQLTVPFPLRLAQYRDEFQGKAVMRGDEGVEVSQAEEGKFGWTSNSTARGN